MSECYYYDSPVTRMNIEFKYHFLPKTMLFVHTNTHGIHQNTESKPVVGGLCRSLLYPFIPPWGHTEASKIMF